MRAEIEPAVFRTRSTSRRHGRRDSARSRWQFCRGRDVGASRGFGHGCETASGARDSSRGPESPQFVYAADLGCDAIFGYRLDATTGGLIALNPPCVKTRPGAGPRHVAFHPDGRRLYAINEPDSTIGVYDIDGMTGRLAQQQIVPSLPDGFSGENATADVKLTPDGGLLLCANMTGGNLAIFRIDRETGRLERVGEPVPMASPSCVAIVP